MTRADAWVTPGEDGWVGGRQQQMHRLCCPPPDPLSSTQSRLHSAGCCYDTTLEQSRQANTGKLLSSRAFWEIFFYSRNNKFARCQVWIAIVVNLSPTCLLQWLFCAKWRAWWDFDNKLGDRSSSWLSGLLRLMRLLRSWGAVLFIIMLSAPCLWYFHWHFHSRGPLSPDN